MIWLRDVVRRLGPLDMIWRSQGGGWRSNQKLWNWEDVVVVLI